MTSTLPDRHRLATVARDIARSGVHVASDPERALVHTVGHAAVHDLPELVVVALPEPEAVALIRDVSRRMRGGWAAPTSPATEVEVGGSVVRFRRRPRPEVETGLLPLAQRYTELLFPGSVIEVLELTVVRPAPGLTLAS